MMWALYTIDYAWTSREYGESAPENFDAGPTSTSARAVLARAACCCVLYSTLVLFITLL